MQTPSLSVSVVLCTYNGAKFLREQLDTILAQDYPLLEVLVQDDGSTDDTASIVAAYAERFPLIRWMKNEAAHGVNGNFFSAMAKAKGDLIAISDQDDLWEPDKVSSQVAALGTKLMSICRSVPFTEDPSISLDYDRRPPNHRLPRLFYSSVPGHTMVFRRSLLTKVPKEGEIYNRTYYDVILGLTAAAYDGIVLVDRVLAHWRRHQEADTLLQADSRRKRSAGNALYMLRWSLTHYAAVKRCMRWHFQPRLDFLRAVAADTEVWRDGVRMMACECRSGLCSYLELTRLYLKYRHELFYTYEKDPVAWVRALLYPLMHMYNYRYLWERGLGKKGE